MAERALILIADMDIGNVEILQARLSAAGYDTIEAYDEEETLKQSIETLPDLILLDIMMPKMGGLDVLKSLKSHEVAKDIPTIMLIPHDEITVVFGESDIEPNEYLTKPISQTELLARIRSCLQMAENTRVQKDAHQRLENTRAQLIHSQKMASLGTLVAGIAHELNNPITFIYDNLDFLQRYIDSLLEMIDFYEIIPVGDQEGKQIEQQKEKLNLDYVRKDLAPLLKNIREGAERTKRIVTGLRTFSRAHEAEYEEIDIHQSLESTLSLLTNRLQNVVRVHRQYGDLPFVECLAGQLEQVFANLLTNAADSLEGEGDIWITTDCGREEGRIWIRIEDNGKGIPEEDISRLFDPFFTTKEAGKGTGLGLKVSHEIIERHGGRIEVESRIGQGSAFTLVLPAKAQKDGTKQSCGKG